MEPYILLTIARTQPLAMRLQGDLDPTHYSIRWVPSTRQALSLDFSPSLVVLDVPPSGGAQSSRQLKQRFTAPLIALVDADCAGQVTAEAQIRRPFKMRDLLELVERTVSAHTPHIVEVPGMSLDTRTRRLLVQGQTHQLRPIGSRIVAVLMTRPNQAVPRAELLGMAWPRDRDDRSRSLDVHIARLRRQIEVDPRHPELIQTERGVGYRLRPPEPAS